MCQQVGMPPALPEFTEDAMIPVCAFGDKFNALFVFMAVSEARDAIVDTVSYICGCPDSTEAMREAWSAYGVNVDARANALRLAIQNEIGPEFDPAV